MMFSIVIPSHDSNATLGNALRSCLGQTFIDFEIIVVDDASRVPAAAVCEGFADPRIRCLRNDANEGASAARNRGLDAARGAYIVLLDADDVYLPNKLEVLARAIEREQTDVLVHRQYRLHGSSSAGASYSELPRKGIKAGDPFEEFTFRGGDYYNNNVVCVSRRLIRTARFRPELRMMEDQAFLYDCVRDARTVTVLDDLLAVYVDDSRDGRASKRYRTADDYREFQTYAQRHLTSRGQALLEATIASDLSVFKHPLRVAKALWGGHRAGMALPRSLFYAFRTVVGVKVANALMDFGRSFRTPAATGAIPDWMSLLEPQREVERIARPPAVSRREAGAR